MINGSAKEFIEGLHYGDERFFLWNGCKYFIQGFFESEKPMLELYVLEPSDNDFEWRALSKDNSYPVSEFENDKILMAKLFGKSKRTLSGWIANKRHS